MHDSAEGGNGAEAVKLALRACELTQRKDIACLDTLAAAYASAGRFGEAVATAQEAWQLARATGQNSTAEEIHMRLQLYRDQKPYREPTKMESK
jgi:spermidine synthase